MDKVPETELLSAYLDGEVTAAEQARAEELLAASPVARQWVEEMRALSHTLQSLPQEKVGEDLGPRVLRLAEQRLLTDAPPVAPAQPVFPPSQPLPPPQPPGRTLRETLRNMLSRRALIWSGLAVAIAVMMTIAENSKPKPDAVPRNIAQAPAKASTAAPADALAKASAKAPASCEKPVCCKAAAAVPAAEKKAEKTAGPEIKAADLTLAPGSAPAGDRDKRQEAAGTETLAGSNTYTGSTTITGGTLVRDKEAVEKDDLSKKAAGKDSVGRKAAESGKEPPEGKLAEDDTRSRASGKDKKKAVDNGALAFDLGSGSGDGSGSGSGSGWGAGSQPAPAADGRALRAGKAAAAEKPLFAAKGAGSGQAAGRSYNKAAPAGSRPPAPAESVLVVQCDVTPDAVRQQTFEKLLVAGGIARTSSPRFAMERNALGPVDLVEARATAMQINALLVQLTARQEAFPLVVVEPATGVAWQQGFGQYTRRAGQNMIGGQNNLNTQSNLNTQNAANTQNNFSNQFVQSGGSAGSGAVAKAEDYNYVTSPQSGGVQPNAQAAPQAAPPAGPQTGQQASPPPAAQYSPQGGLGYGGEPSPARQQEARTRPTKASGAVTQQPQDAGVGQNQAARGAAAPQVPEVQKQARSQMQQVVVYRVLFVLRRVGQPPPLANAAVQPQQSPAASPNAAAAPTQAAAEQPPPAAPSAAPPPRTVPSK